MIRKQRGAVYLILLLVMSGVFIFLATAIMGLAFSNLKLARHNESMVSSLSVAEAGVNYYLWHLSHNVTDYCDGHLQSDGKTCSEAGPYQHPFYGPDGAYLGDFTLTITPPAPGKTITEIKAMGTAKNASVSRTVVAGIGMPSFAAYAVLTNTENYIVANTTTDGPVHSNNGIRYDPPNPNDTISASRVTFTPTKGFGGIDAAGNSCNPSPCVQQNGVWSPLKSVDDPTWQYNPQVPPVDFTKINADLAALKVAANDNGIYLSTSTPKGYYLNLKGNTIDVYKVNSENSNGIQTTFIENRPAPTNGILYSDYPVWIDGTWSSKITIATAANTSDMTSVTIVNNLLYSLPRNDGTKKIGIVCKYNIRIPTYIPGNNMEIDAALLSEYGWIGYSPWSGPKKDGTITIYGSIMGYNGSVFRYVYYDLVTWAGGFRYVLQIYDRNLTVDPPPLYPVTGKYSVLTWREE